MTFHPEILERLLFPLNEEIYTDIQNTLHCLGKNHLYFDMSINFNQNGLNIENLQSSTDFEIGLTYIKNTSSTSHRNILNISFSQHNEFNTFQIPLEYLLGYKNKEILMSLSHYIYSYTLKINKNLNIYSFNKKAKIHDENESYLYIGRTKQSWLNRNAYHCQDIKLKPHRLIYQALNGNFGTIIEKKLVIEKAGLTESEAKFIEKGEIENRSLNEKFPNGLNMIAEDYFYPSYPIIKAS